MPRPVKGAEPHMVHTCVSTVASQVQQQQTHYIDFQREKEFQNKSPVDCLILKRFVIFCQFNKIFLALDK